MAKLQEIERSIYSMGPAAFQDLADAYLSKIYPEWSLVSRPGSQIGKQKTIKGTPDSIFKTADGKFIFVQHSTDESGGVKKLKSDVDKCMTPSKMGIRTEQIDHIVLCLNFRLKLDQISEIEKYNSKVQLIPFDKIVQDIHLKFSTLVSKYLGIQFEAPQLLDIDEFVAQYDSSANRLATPLNIPFKYRENEMVEIIEALKREDIVILQGLAGSGKTRLAVQSVRSLRNEKKCLVLSCKNSLRESEMACLKADTSDIVLFVDDVNRLSKDFIEDLLTEFLREGAPARKLLLTVRNYATGEIKDMVKGYRYKIIPVGKFTDDEIKGIISEEPFNIRNTIYQDRIVSIADGNPRIAIMAARLALEKQTLESLHDLSDLFALYYSRIEKEIACLKDSQYVKVLGLLGFFHHIELSETGTLAQILCAFEMDGPTFRDALIKLNDWELVDQYVDVVRISEQNLGLYYFWLAFFEKELLSFDVLLRLFFHSQASRFKDVINPITSLFGYTRVKEKIESALLAYTKNVGEAGERGFYEVFYLFIPEQTLTFVMSHYDDCPDITVTEYQTGYNPNDFSFDYHSDFHLLGELCQTHLEYLSDALEVMLGIVRKNPDKMPRLIYTLKKTFNVRLEDVRNGYIRQNRLISLFQRKMEAGDTVAISAFPEIAKMLLPFSFQDTSSGRKNTVSIYTLNIKLDVGVKALRKSIWYLLNRLGPEKINDVLSHYGGIVEESSLAVAEYDFQFVVEIVEAHLSPGVFGHCLTVHKLKRWFERHNMLQEQFETIFECYTNPAFEMYQVFMEGNDYQDNSMWEKRIRDSFKITGPYEQESFVRDYRTVKEGMEGHEGYRFNEALDFVVDETMCCSLSLGCSLMASLIELEYYPYLPFKNHLVSEDAINEIWGTIKHLNAPSRLCFFSGIPKSVITDHWGLCFIETMKELPSSSKLRCSHYKILLEGCPKIMEPIFQYVINYERPILDDDWIEYALSVSVPIELVEQCYLTCFRNRHYDYNGYAMLCILRRDKSFLPRFLGDLRPDEELPELGYLWSLKDSEMMRSAFDYMIEHNWDFIGGIYEHLFESVPDAQYHDVESFLLSYVRENYADERKMDAVVEVVESKMPKAKRPVVHAFLAQTTSLNVFEKVNWTKEPIVVFSGHVNLGERDVQRWKRLLEDVNSSGLGAKLNPIQAYIKQRIASCGERIEYFRRRDFINDE